MSSTTKRTPIDKESQEYLDTLMTTPQMYRALSDYERSIKEENDVKKRMIANEIAAMGDIFIQEIDEKHELIEEERLDMIEFIIQTTKEELVPAKELRNMSHDEVKSIYVKAQDSKKSWYQLLLEFITG